MIEKVVVREIIHTPDFSENDPRSYIEAIIVESDRRIIPAFVLHYVRSRVISKRLGKIKYEHRYAEFITKEELMNAYYRHVRGGIGEKSVIESRLIRTDSLCGFKTDDETFYKQRVRIDADKY